MPNMPDSGGGAPTPQHHNPPPNAVPVTPQSNWAEIATFLASKGLSRVAIAGIMGNLEVESSFNPGAYNANEGAIGIAQWEGGRRTALQEFARANGGSETDLDIQLQFLWHELTTSEGGALHAITTAPTVQAAAAAFDSQYERSAGTTRAARIDNAVRIYETNPNLGVGTYSGGAGTITGGTEMAATSGGGNLLNPDASTFQQALGPLAGLLKAVPELQSLLNEAVGNGWSIDKFINNVENSAWYRDHSATARQYIALQASDPAEYQRQIARQKDAITTQVDAMGVSLNSDQLNALALDDMIGGWDTATLQRHIAAVANYGFGAGFTANALKGNAASAYQQLTQLYSEYGVPISAASLAGQVKQLVAGTTSIDTFKQHAITTAQSMYPGLAAQIKGGLTVKQIADPYVQQMGSLLEIDPNTIDLSNPLIKKALQGTTVTDAKGNATTTVTPLWQFENQVRSDPRWQYTSNARDAGYAAMMQLGQDWGFE